MIDILKRINESAKKQREEGLTNAEKVEQQALRGDYLRIIRSKFFNRLIKLLVGSIPTWSRQKVHRSDV